MVDGPYDLSKFKETLAVEAHGMTREQAHAQGVCIVCKKPPTFTTKDGPGEYRISATCEPCFDAATSMRVATQDEIEDYERCLPDSFHRAIEKSNNDPL